MVKIKSYRYSTDAEDTASASIKVSELISELQMMNPDDKVVISNADGTYSYLNECCIIDDSYS